MTKEREEFRRRVASEVLIALLTKQVTPSAITFVDGHGAQSVAEFAVLIATDLVHRLEATQLWLAAPNPYASPKVDG